MRGQPSLRCSAALRSEFRVCGWKLEQLTEKPTSRVNCQCCTWQVALKQLKFLLSGASLPLPWADKLSHACRFILWKPQLTSLCVPPGTPRKWQVLIVPSLECCNWNSKFRENCFSQAFYPGGCQRARRNNKYRLIQIMQQMTYSHGKESPFHGICHSHEYLE